MIGVPHIGSRVGASGNARVACLATAHRLGLGSFGAESAFSGAYDLSNRTAGALFVGPPNFNTLFREFSDHRDAGSLESLPVYQSGRIVRFANDPRVDIPPDGHSWDGTFCTWLRW